MSADQENAAMVLAAAASCGNCGAEERRLLHHVRHRGTFRRLCTTCVLRLHAQYFCPTCFQVHPSTPSNDAVVNCFKCYSSSHSSCVTPGRGSPSSPYICPLCTNPTSPIFSLKSANERSLRVSQGNEELRVLDRDAAKKLLAAAKIASTVMNKAAVVAKAEAERRAKEAAFARKRAREALEHVADLVMKGKFRKKEATLTVPDGISLPRVNEGYFGSGGLAVAMVNGVKSVNVNHVNRNGSMDNFVDALSVRGEKYRDASTRVDVDELETSNEVLAALNWVDLKETEMDGITRQGSDWGEHVNDSLTLMDVDENARTSEVAGEDDEGGLWGDDASTSDIDIISQLWGDEEDHNMEETKREEVENGRGGDVSTDDIDIISQLYGDEEDHNMQGTGREEVDKGSGADVSDCDIDIISQLCGDGEDHNMQGTGREEMDKRSGGDVIACDIDIISQLGGDEDHNIQGREQEEVEKETVLVMPDVDRIESTANGNCKEQLDNVTLP